jgi:ABC-type branched-subunit amino acid transport system substrate-binding protein
MLIFNDVSTPKLLGTNLWHTPDLVKRGTKLIENCLFVDAEFSVSNRWKSSAFFKDYKKLYGEEPSLFEAQAFDVAMALRSIVSSGARSRSAVKDALASLKNFPGSLGAVSVNEHREFSRPISVLTVNEGQIKEAVPPAETKTN